MEHLYGGTVDGEDGRGSQNGDDVCAGTDDSDYLSVDINRYHLYLRRRGPTIPNTANYDDQTIILHIKDDDPLL